ncbi:MAG: isoprenylcysteine carboxylmethyltransferase family protein [Bacteroidota bacterium]|nr:MAG: isoprenylcysteine carboxylmethyltransferase family protein [Bacteroidota bacterium]
MKKKMKKNNTMNIIGKATINPLLFYTGKISGYLTWIFLVLSFINIETVEVNDFYFNRAFSVVLIIAGLTFTVISLINLGNSTRLGLPNETTHFKTKGLYKFSRNPMYVGFNLITLSSIIHFLSPWTIILGIYSIFVYHLIILGEERFLESRFGTNYISYKEKVRRYL